MMDDYEKKYVEAQTTEQLSKELILSFKTIYKNTYQFIVINIEDDKNKFVFNHEISHVFEQ